MDPFSVVDLPELPLRVAEEFTEMMRQTTFLLTPLK